MKEIFITKINSFLIKNNLNQLTVDEINNNLALASVCESSTVNCFFNALASVLGSRLVNQDVYNNFAEVLTQNSLSVNDLGFSVAVNNKTKVVYIV